MRVKTFVVLLVLLERSRPPRSLRRRAAGRPPQPPPGAASMAPPPVYPAAELDRIVSPIALYPDPLLAQVLTAATFASDIPEAARWSDQHHYLTDAALASAIAADRLPWDPAIQALLPFPSVLGMMASSMPWTEEIGTAFLAQQADVMDAVQRMRQRAQSYGYLRSTPSLTVRSGPYIEILPSNPAFVVVPYYDPLIVFAPPRRGIYGVIGFGYGVRLGPAWAPWGWGTTRFGWSERVVIVNNAPWQRTWANRVTYVHPTRRRGTAASGARPSRIAPSSAASASATPRAKGRRKKRSTSARRGEAQTIGSSMTAPPSDRIGLCASCRLVEVVTSSRGSTFYLCTLAATNPAFRRYPILPVRQCHGYEPGAPSPRTLRALTNPVNPDPEPCVTLYPWASRRISASSSRSTTRASAPSSRTTRRCSTSRPRRSRRARARSSTWASAPARCRRAAWRRRRGRVRSASTSTRRSSRWPRGGSATRATFDRRLLPARAAAGVRRAGRVLRAASRPHARGESGALPPDPRRAPARRRLPQRRLRAGDRPGRPARAVRRVAGAPAAGLQRRRRPAAHLRAWSHEDVYVPLDAEIALLRSAASASSCSGAAARSPSSGPRVSSRLKSLDGSRARELVRPGGGRLPSALGGAVAARPARAVPQADRALVRGDRGRRARRLHLDRPDRRLHLRADAPGAAAGHEADLHRAGRGVLALHQHRADRGHRRSRRRSSCSRCGG